MSPLAGRSVLVTGGAGAFGQAFVAHALARGASRVAVFSRSESTQAAMRARMTDDRLRFLIGDVRDRDRLESALRGVDIVVHAAALKRVEVCEADPRESRETNVNGTANVAAACIAAGVQKAVFLSTDKAAAPNTVYGAHKLAAEREWNQGNVYAAGTPTRLSVTRYGNVINSTGSVVPLWRTMAGAIPITDPRMSRFFMSMDDAVALVELALREMRGGEVFVPKLHAARLTMLASVVAPGRPTRTVGIRPGEKLHEVLITADEARQTFDHGDHYRIEPTRMWSSEGTPPAPRVPDTFTYSSETCGALSMDELTALVAA